MADHELHVGELVVHPARPEWGPGKVVRVESPAVQVVFRDTPDRAAKRIRVDVVPLKRAADQRDEYLDNLPPLSEEAGLLVLPKERVTFEAALATFQRRFPLGFADPDYLGDNKSGERLYKWRAHETWVREMGDGQLQRLIGVDLHEAVRRALHCVGQTNLLYPVEAAALRDALQDDRAAERFLNALAAVLSAPVVDEGVVAPYFDAVVNLPAERARVASWPVATVLPFLAQPDRHMFLKPGVCGEAAERLGFNLNYRAQPNWLTYASLLRMADFCRRRIGHLAPRDMIDIYSFLYVTCGGYQRLGLE